MTAYRRLAVAIFVGSASLTSVLPSGQADEDGRSLTGQDWTHYGGNLSSARFSTLTHITPENVKNLGAVWSMTFDAGASTRAAPVVKDGVMFISAGSRLYALDAKTGTKLWTWRP